MTTAPSAAEWRNCVWPICWRSPTPHRIPAWPGGSLWLRADHIAPAFHPAPSTASAPDWLRGHALGMNGPGLMPPVGSQPAHPPHQDLESAFYCWWSPDPGTLAVLVRVARCPGLWRRIPDGSRCRLAPTAAEIRRLFNGLVIQGVGKVIWWWPGSWRHAGVGRGKSAGTALGVIIAVLTPARSFPGGHARAAIITGLTLL